MPLIAASGTNTQHPPPTSHERRVTGHDFSLYFQPKIEYNTQDLAVFRTDADLADPKLNAPQ
jgi:hypothetical protein